MELYNRIFDLLRESEYEEILKAKRYDFESFIECIKDKHEECLKEDKIEFLETGYNTVPFDGYDEDYCIFCSKCNKVEFIRPNSAKIYDALF